MYKNEQIFNYQAYINSEYLSISDESFAQTRVHWLNEDRVPYFLSETRACLYLAKKAKTVYLSILLNGIDWGQI